MQRRVYPTTLRQQLRVNDYKTPDTYLRRTPSRELKACLGILRIDIRIHDLNEHTQVFMLD